MSNFFDIGVIVNTQGIKGDVRVMPVTDDPNRFSLLNHIYVEKNGLMTLYDIERVWYHKQFVILKLKGIDDMNAGEALKQGTIKISPEFALPLSENEYYIRDLYGMRVFTDSGTELGELSEVMQTGANDVYSVKREGKKDILIPAIQDCIIDVNVLEKKMVVHLLDGMI